jgi:uncharacterized protein
MLRALRVVVWSLAATLAAVNAYAQTDLILSEYVEGSSNNKAVEIFNPTGAAIDMTAGAYKIQIFANGSATATSTIALTGTLGSGARWVVANSAASATVLSAANATSGSLNYNGNDAVAIVKTAANTLVDVLGQIGFDPGVEWGTGVQSTMDNTLRRKAAVCDGDTNGSDVFDPTIQWDGFVVDTFSGLGAHSVSCGPTPTLSPTWGAVKMLYR